MISGFRAPAGRRAFWASTALVLALLLVPSRAQPFLNGSEARAFLGGRTGKMAYLKGLTRQIYFLDFSDSVLTEKKVSDDIYCWSPMIHPDGSRIVYESQSSIYIRYLEGNSTQRFMVYAGTPVNGQSLEPHWWIHPVTGDEYVIFCTGNVDDIEWPPKSGQTYIQKINKATNLPEGALQTMLPFLMASGRSKNGLWGATSHHSTGMYKLYAEKTSNAFFSSKNWQDSGGWSACNGSISPSSEPARQNRIMHLNSFEALPDGEIFENHKAIIIRSWDDADLGHPIWTMGIPGIRCNNDSSGNLFWDHSEWATDEEYFTAIGTKVIENWDSTDIYMGRIKYAGDSQIRRVIRGFHGQYPHLWIKTGVRPAKIKLGKAALDFITLKRDSAGPADQVLEVSNAGDGTLPNLEIGGLPAWLKVTLQDNGTNAPKLINAVDRSLVAPGNYVATVRVSFGQSADSALYTVNLKYTDPVLTSCRAHPVSVELMPGDTVRFSAEALDQTGQPLVPQPKILWTALTDLPIDSLGLVKADTGFWKKSLFRANANGVVCTTQVFVCHRKLRIDAGAAPDSVPEGWNSDESMASDWPRAARWEDQVNLPKVKNAAPEAVYRTIRYPAGPYRFDSLPNGRYQVRLHFTSSFPGREPLPTGLSVKAEGVRVLDNYTLPARPDSGLQGETREVLVTVSDGDGLKLEFEGVADAIALAGLEIHDVGGLSIEVLSPKGGEVANLGDTLHIRWRTDELISSAGIQFSPDSGKSWIPVTRRSSVNLGQPAWGDYPWVIPDSLDGFSLASEKCLISVYDYFGSDRDRSDQVFAVRAGMNTRLIPALDGQAAFSLKSGSGRFIFGLNRPGQYRAELTDLRGRSTATAQGQGPGPLTLNASGLRRGVYRLVLVGPGISMTRMVTLIE